MTFDSWAERLVQWMAFAVLLLAIALTAMAFCSCRHAPTGSFDVAPKPDAGTADLSWGSP